MAFRRCLIAEAIFHSPLFRQLHECRITSIICPRLSASFYFSHASALCATRGSQPLARVEAKFQPMFRSLQSTHRVILINTDNFLVRRVTHRHSILSHRLCHFTSYFRILAALQRLSESPLAHLSGRHFGFCEELFGIGRMGLESFWLALFDSLGRRALLPTLIAFSFRLDIGIDY